MEASSKKPKRKRRGAPPTTNKSIERASIAEANAMAKEQLEARTATSQIVLHFLKQGAEKTKLEEEKISLENELLKAKTEAIKSAERIEALYEEAIKAMRGYGGLPDEDIDV